MYCCHCLQNMIANAGQRGMSILIAKAPAQYDIWFVLQSRGIAYEDEKKIKPIPPEYVPDPYLTNISCEMVIKYCPGCGHQLYDSVNPSRAGYEILIEKHKIYLSKDFYNI